MPGRSSERSSERSREREARPSPSESATMFAVGTVRKGNDGLPWKIAQASGVKRWTRDPSIKLVRVHDNGGRPFVVALDGKHAIVYKQTVSADSIIKQYKYIDAFVGPSVLLRLTASKYAFIGMFVYEFSIPERFVKFKPGMDRNDVPIPFVVTEKNIYLLAEQVYMPLDTLSAKDKRDPYGYYYTTPAKNRHTAKMRVKLVHKRLWE